MSHARGLGVRRHARISGRNGAAPTPGRRPGWHPLHGATLDSCMRRPWACRGPPYGAPASTPDAKCPRPTPPLEPGVPEDPRPQLRHRRRCTFLYLHLRRPFLTIVQAAVRTACGHPGGGPARRMPCPACVVHDGHDMPADPPAAAAARTPA